MDFQTVVEKREFAHPICEDVEFKLGGDRKYFGIRQKGDQRTGMFLVLNFTNDFKLARRFALSKSDQIDFTVPGNLGLKPLRKSVHALGADTVQASGKLVSSLSELAAGMEVGQHQFDGGHLKFRMRFNRNSAPIIADGNRAVDVDGHVDPGTKTGQMLVNGVVQDLEDTVM